MTGSQYRSFREAVANLLCVFFGHNYSIEPPWTGKELVVHRPHCERCGCEPEEIRITGSADPYVRQSVRSGGES